MRNDNWEILHRFNQQILSTYCGQVMDLGSGDTGVRRIDKANEFITFTFY